LNWDRPVVAGICDHGRLRMIRVALILSALAVTVGATFASPSAPLVIGVNEDHPKFQEDAGAGMFGELSAIGLTESVISVRWDPEQPEPIPDEANLAATIAAAKEKGVNVVLAVYPAKARAVADNGAAGFVEFCGRVATAFPDAAAFIVGNEPNQPRFWQPQFGADGRQVSAAAFLTVLAGCYDKIHPTGKLVIGVGLSPRGNDNPLASSNISTSPVRFIRALGAAYRASGRTGPIMDAFSFHPYPNANSDTPFVGYRWPNAGMPNFDRIKQALWDAFNGTRQSHVENGLPLWLDEVGWQVPTGGSEGYTGAENVPTVDEARQAAFHGAVVRMAACDKHVATIHFFHWIDETDRGGFQSGAFRADGSPRPAFDAIAQAVADTKGGSFCPGTPVNWRHRTSVVGAVATFPRLPARAIDASARENALVTYGLIDVGRKRTLTAADKKAVAVALVLRSTRSVRARFGAAVTRSELLRANSTRRLLLPATRLRASRYVVAVSMAAESNRERTSLFVGPTFAGGGALVATTAPAGPVLSETARVSGSVKAPLGAKVEVWFEYGPRLTLTRSTKPVLLAPGVLTVSAQLADLRPYARWSYRLVARERGKPATKVVGATRIFMLKKPTS
jgi:hypothetical protein